MGICYELYHPEKKVVLYFGKSRALTHGGPFTLPDLYDFFIDALRDTEDMHLLSWGDMGYIRAWFERHELEYCYVTSEISHDRPFEFSDDDFEAGRCTWRQLYSLRTEWSTEIIQDRLR